MRLVKQQKQRVQRREKDKSKIDSNIAVNNLIPENNK
jgi:hypothetical protein